MAVVPATVAGQPQSLLQPIVAAGPTSEDEAFLQAELKQHQAVPFSFAELEAEIEALRACPPPCVHHVGNLKVPSMLCGEDGRLREVQDGVWDLTVSVSGSEENAAYNFPFQMIIRFNKTYPMVHPEVRFQCVIHHPMISQGGDLPTQFYDTTPRDGRGAYTLPLLVRATHDFLVDPLAWWNVPKGLLAALVASGRENEERLSVIRRYSGMALHRELFMSPPVWREEWFVPAFWKAHASGRGEDWRAALREELPGEVFSMPIFTDAFCDLLVGEIFNFYKSGLPARRPNSMNNYGIILNDIGFEPMMLELRRMLQPLGKLLFPGPGNDWDGHHCFIVRYRAGEDLGLDMHTDDSEVTFNICLGIQFEGATLQICGLFGTTDHRKQLGTYTHKKGTCLVHLGSRRHGADDITSGERLNMVLWTTSSTYRRSSEFRMPPYQREEGPPDEVCLSYTHDRDFGVFKEYPLGKESFRGEGWCPPTPYEYDNFKQDTEPISDA